MIMLVTATPATGHSPSGLQSGSAALAPHALVTTQVPYNTAKVTKPGMTMASVIHTEIPRKADIVR